MEDVLEAGVDVVRGEGDELIAASEHFSEEADGIERVGEVSKEPLSPTPR
jgi:hypothetical protein